MQIKRNIRPIISATFFKWTFICLFDQVIGSSDFFLGLLSPQLCPLFFSLFQGLNVFIELFVLNGIVLDLSDHYLIEQVYFPELLIVANLLVILWIDYIIGQKHTWICRMTFLHDNLINNSFILFMKNSSYTLDFIDDLVFKLL